MNKKIIAKAIFIDLDGTALDDWKNGKAVMSRINKKSIKEINKEIPVIISTGRVARDVLPLAKSLGLKYSICQNGAMIFDSQGKRIFKDLIPKPEAEKILTCIQKNKLMYKINGEKNFYGTKWFVKKILSKLDFIFNKSYHSKSDIEAIAEYSKIVICGKLRKNMGKLKKQLSKDFPNLFIITSFNGYSIEITGKKASKGLADAWVCKKLKIDPKDAIHIGDSMNDSTTVGVTKLIAMANSNKKLIHLADFIGPNYKKAGLAKLLKYIEIK